MITGKRNRTPERLFILLCQAAVILPLGLLALLFGDVLIDALPRLGWGFLTSFPSRKPEIAGVYPASRASASAF